ncbi:hypothetical protein [Streptomyces sp. PT12]|nr:hypothetical protein [Streptomyces sp. PT12]
MRDGGRSAAEIARALVADVDQAVLDDALAWLTDQEHPGPW